MEKDRIVITGMGVLAPNGIGLDAFWRNTLAGKSGISEIRGWDGVSQKARYGGQIQDFSLEAWTPFNPVNVPGRGAQLALGACTMALTDAGLDQAQYRPRKTGLYLGTTMGESQIAERYDREAPKAEGRQPPDYLAYYPSNVLPALVSDFLGLSGPCGLIPTACAAGNYAIGYAYDLLAAGQASCMLAGGVDPWSGIAYDGFLSMFAISPDRCKPFDKERQGILISEGAAALVLEREADARKRGARIYAELAGYGLGADGYHMTGPHPEGRGGILAGRRALAMARVRTDEVDYISAHGTGTKSNDRIETLILEKLFEERASRIPTSSIKSMLGHTMGAASAIEAVACVKAIERGAVPPTVNYATPDPECALDVVPNHCREIKVRVAMNNSFAFGGNCAATVFRAWDGRAA